jgi:hypothetical protein
MNPVFAAAYDLQQFCMQAGWRFCFIGGVAVQRWGEPRFTRDADLTLLSGFGDEEAYIDRLLAQYAARVDDARAFALETRVVLLTGLGAVPLDISLGAMPFEERTVERASLYAINEQHSLLTCSAEDLIVHKAFAARPQDWLDIDGIVGRFGPHLAWPQIWEELEPLVELKEEPAILERLRAIQSDAGQAPDIRPT